MEGLPTELVELVLSSNSLRLEDIINVSKTCKHFRDIVQNSNRVWRSVYFKLWPQYSKYHDDKTTDFFKETKYVFAIRQEAKLNLETMSARFYLKPNLCKTDFYDWDLLIDEDERKLELVIDYLTETLNDFVPISSLTPVQIMTRGNETLKYYCTKTIRYLRHNETMKGLKIYMSLPQNEQILEKAAQIVAQWCQPGEDLSYENLSKQLDHISDLVRRELRVINPQHPLFTADKKTLDHWRDGNIYQNSYCEHECIEVLDALQTILYKKLRFYGNSNDYYKYQNSFINVVLERRLGIPITMSIVYESVARRLGVNCEPMNLPGHFLLRYVNDSNKKYVLYIDPFNKGQRLQKSRDEHSSVSKIPRATAMQVLRRMVANLEECWRTQGDVSESLNLCSIYKLMALISPNDINHALNLARITISMNLDTDFVKEIIEANLNEYEDRNSAENILKMLHDYEVHRRNEDLYEVRLPKKRMSVLYAVGMVIQLFNKKGVITDWNYNSDCTVEGWPEALKQSKMNQPSYHIIFEDGTQSWLIEDHIRLVPDINFPFFNEQLGKHFSHFFFNHYVPNMEKEKEYPEDAIVRRNYFQSQIWMLTDMSTIMGDKK